jgi:hypothetical protein
MSTTLVPQALGKSCWAASLEMFTGQQLLQCQLLNDDFTGNPAGEVPAFCDPDWQTNNRSRFTGNTKTLTEVEVKLSQHAGGPIPSRVVRGRLPRFERLRSDIGSSAITLYSWKTASDLHYIVLNKTTEQMLTTSDMIQWIRVLDPFPVLRGRTYYLNYREFSGSGWFKGIVYHRTNGNSSVAAPPVFSDSDPKRLVQTYIDKLPETIDSDFQQVTHIAPSHRILDIEFDVTNTYVDTLVNGSDHFFNNILARARNMKMYLTGSGGDHTSFFVNSANGKYHISTMENGLRYYPVTNLTDVIVPATMGVTMASESRAAGKKQIKNPEDGNQIERDFIRYFKKRPQTALICRFYDIGQEYAFFLSNGKVRVFDPFHSFAYILPENQKETYHISLDEFFKALTQFYPTLNIK